MDNKYLMAFDNEGNIIGFYPKDMIEMYQNIPSKTVEITEDKHNFYMQNNGKYKLDPITLEDELIPIPTPQPQPPSEDDRLSAIENAISVLMGV